MVTHEFFDFFNANSCVYWIIYSGTKHPANYVGSAFLDHVLRKNYLGSTSSTKWKSIVEAEMKENPQLYKLSIIEMCETREIASTTESTYHKRLDVARNENFWNMTNARGGRFGVDTTKGTRWMTNGTKFKMLKQLPDGWWFEAPKKPRDSKMNISSSLALAKECKSLGEFRRLYPSHCTAAYAGGYIDELKAVLPHQHSWTFEECRSAAAECETRVEFKETFPAKAAKAYREKWLTSICQHMRPGYHRRMVKNI